MLNQAVLIGKVVDIQPYNENKCVAFSVLWSEQERGIPLRITHPSMAESFIKLIQEGGVAGFKGVMVQGYKDEGDVGVQLQFKVMKFSVLEKRKESSNEASAQETTRAMA